MNFNFYRLSQNNRNFRDVGLKGFSIVEVLVVLGLVSIIGAVLTTMVMNSMKAQKNVQLNTERTNLENSILGVLRDNALCRSGLRDGGGNPLTYTGATIPVNQIRIAGASYAQVSAVDMGVRITAMELIPVQDLGPYKYTSWNMVPNPPVATILDYHKYLAQLRVVTEKVDGTANGRATFYGSKTREVFFNVTLLTNAANVIADCFAEDSAAKACDDMNGIFDANAVPRCMLQNLGVGFRNAGLVSDPQALNLEDPALLIRGSYNAGASLDKTVYLLADNTTTSRTAGITIAAAPAGVFVGGGAIGTGNVPGAFGLNTQPGDFSVGSAVGKDLHFVTSNAPGNPPTRIIVKRDGKVGIGSLTPSNRLEVKGLSNAAGSLDYTLALRTDGSATSKTAGLNIYINDAGGNWVGGGQIGSGLLAGNFNIAAAGNLGISSAPGKDIDFSTVVAPSNTGFRRMTIKNDGSIGVGTSGPEALIHVESTSQATMLLRGAGEAANGSYSALYLGKTGFNALDNSWVFAHKRGPEGSLQIGRWRLGAISVPLAIGDNNGYVGIGNIIAPTEALDVNGNIKASGNISAAGYITSTSDERLKKNFSPISGALEKILSLKGYYFQWKDPKKDSSRQVGLKAQEVKKVFPELVVTDHEGFLAVSYQNLIAPVIEAIRELYDKVTALLHREGERDIEIAKLKKENQDIKAENQEIKAALCELSPKASFCGKKQTKPKDNKQ